MQNKPQKKELIFIARSLGLSQGLEQKGKNSRFLPTQAVAGEASRIIPFTFCITFINVYSFYYVQPPPLFPFFLLFFYYYHFFFKIKVLSAFTMGKYILRHLINYNGSVCTPPPLLGCQTHSKSQINQRTLLPRPTNCSHLECYF